MVCARFLSIRNHDNAVYYILLKCCKLITKKNLTYRSSQETKVSTYSNCIVTVYPFKVRTFSQHCFYSILASKAFVTTFFIYWIKFSLVIVYTYHIMIKADINKCSGFIHFMHGCNQSYNTIVQKQIGFSIKCKHM